MTEYRGNSFKSKEKNVSKVITGKAKIKKKTVLERIVDTFIAGDMDSIRSYVISDIIIPTAKKTIYEIFTNSLDMALNGGNGRRQKQGASKISYRDCYNDKKYISRHRGVCEYDDIVVETRQEAEDILNNMDDLISQFGVVSVGEFYDMAGLVGNSSTYNYGWKDIHTALIMRVAGGGYMIKLPKALPIN